MEEDYNKEFLIMAIFFITMVGLLVALGRMLYRDFCRKRLRQNNSGPYLDQSQAIFYVTKEATVTTESHQDGETSYIVYLLNDQINNQINASK